MLFFTKNDITTTSTTLVDVPGFALRCVAGNVYTFDFNLVIGSSDANGLKVAIVVPAGTQFRAFCIGNASSSTSLEVDVITQSGVVGIAFNTFAGTGNYLNIKGGAMTGPNTGYLKLQAEKVVAGTATLGAGSYLTIDLSS
jgi:hypothetical protein